MAVKVENAQCGFSIRLGVKDDPATVRRPAPIPLPTVIVWNQTVRLAALSRHHIKHLSILRVRSGREDYLVSVRGPARARGIEGRVGELDPSTAVRVSPPEYSLGEGDIGNRF